MTDKDYLEDYLENWFDESPQSKIEQNKETEHIDSSIRTVREKIDSIDSQIRKHIVTRELIEPSKIYLTDLIDISMKRGNDLNLSLICLSNPISLISGWVSYIFSGNLVERDLELVHLIIQRIRLAPDIAEIKLTVCPEIIKAESKQDMKNMINLAHVDSELKKGLNFTDILHNKIFSEIKRGDQISYCSHHLITLFTAVIYPLTEREEVEYICFTRCPELFKREYGYSVY
jgi:chorismate mutase